MEKVIVYQHTDEEWYLFDRGDDLERAREITREDIQFYELKKNKDGFSHINQEKISQLKLKLRTLRVIPVEEFEGEIPWKKL